MSSDEHTDDTSKSSNSETLVLATGDRGSVFTGAVLVGISVFDASQTLAIRASGAHPNSDALGAVLTLLVFAVGVVFLVQGSAGVYAGKRGSV